MFSGLTIFEWSVLIAYLVVLVVVSVYGLHRYVLVWLYYRHRRGVPQLEACFAELPRVTVQLPMFNERFVARRVIEKACAIDYPADRLQIQVLDDSTDDTTEIVRAVVDECRARGHDIELLHRDDRTGFKAGALQAGMASATGELICIFDADFVPTTDILHSTVHHFTRPEVGMVQVRWEHLNREQSWLTRAQAVLLDGHFVMEHGARNRSGRFMSFNGTAGIWRRESIDDAGGWQHDTLTEDLDLSYRAQMKGWQFLFLQYTDVPAELPPVMDAFKAQQFRWTKGGAQTCRKLLPAVLRSSLPWRIKIEAFFHLTSNVVYPFVVLLTLLVFPAIYIIGTLGGVHHVWARVLGGFSILLLATFSAGTFYVCSQRELQRSWWDSIKCLPAIMSLGIGIAVNNAWAMIQGFAGRQSDFIRTPKYAASSASTVNDSGYRPLRSFKLQPWIELALGCYLLVCLVLSLRPGGLWLGSPFLLLFALGYLAVGLATLRACRD